MAVPSPSWAGYKYRFDERMNQRGQYELEVSEKLTRGINNTIYGWTEMARTPIDWAERPGRGVLGALILGVPYGFFRMLGRTFVGIYEMGTCYAPQKPIFSEIEGDVL